MNPTTNHMSVQGVFILLQAMFAQRQEASLYCDQKFGGVLCMYPFRLEWAMRRMVKGLNENKRALKETEPTLCLKELEYGMS